jgi:hypothetical protein
MKIPITESQPKKIIKTAEIISSKYLGLFSLKENCLNFKFINGSFDIISHGMIRQMK